MSWALTLLGIALLIILHELGHFAVAKAVGMRVERFSLFFPPRLAGVKVGETDYAIGTIPAGGYVKITGMTWDEVKNLDLRVAVHAYCLQPPWKRVAVILAGPGVNLLIALVLFWVVLVSGNLDGATTLSNLNPSIETLRSTTSVGAVIEKTAAVGVLKVGDRFISVDGQPATVNGIRNVVGRDLCAGRLVSGCHAQEPVNIVLRRAGRTLDASVYPQYDAAEKRMLIGFAFGATAKRYGSVAAVGVVGREVAKTAASIVSGLEKALTSSRARSELHSIVGITEVAHEAVAGGWGFGFVVLGFVSLALAVINLFPFLPLDGGHVLWAVAEKVRGHRIPMAAMVRFSSVGMVLLLFLVFNGFYNDLTRLGA